MPHEPNSPSAALPLSDENRLLRLMLRGVTSAKALYQETGISHDQIRAFLSEVGVPYGAGGFGMFPWPGSREENKQSGVNMFPSVASRASRDIHRKGIRRSRQARPDPLFCIPAVWLCCMRVAFDVVRMTKRIRRMSPDMPRR